MTEKRVEIKSDDMIAELKKSMEVIKSVRVRAKLLNSVQCLLMLRDREAYQSSSMKLVELLRGYCKKESLGISEGLYDQVTLMHKYSKDEELKANESISEILREYDLLENFLLRDKGFWNMHNIERLNKFIEETLFADEQIETFSLQQLPGHFLHKLQTSITDYYTSRRYRLIASERYEACDYMIFRKEEQVIRIGIHFYNLRVSVKVEEDNCVFFLY